MKKLVILSMLGLMSVSLYLFLPERNSTETNYLKFVDLVYFDSEINQHIFIEEEKEIKCPYLAKKSSKENRCPVTGMKSKGDNNECPVSGKNSMKEKNEDASVCPFNNAEGKTKTIENDTQKLIKVRST